LQVSNAAALRQRLRRPQEPANWSGIGRD
jgi:hypothetical protein